MSIRYRVDRSDSPVRVPCGMNSIVHMGGDWARAYKVFRDTSPGISMWGKPSPVFGVTLSVWDDNKRDYVVKCSKGFNLQEA
jgi:hypothetical protein